MLRKGLRWTPESFSHAEGSAGPGVGCVLILWYSCSDQPVLKLALLGFYYYVFYWLYFEGYVFFTLGNCQVRSKFEGYKCSKWIPLRSSPKTCLLFFKNPPFPCHVTLKECTEHIAKHSGMTMRCVSQNSWGVQSEILLWKKRTWQESWWVRPLVHLVQQPISQCNRSVFLDGWQTGHRGQALPQCYCNDFSCVVKFL